MCITFMYIMLTLIFIYMNAGNSCYAYVFRIIHIYTLKMKICWKYTYPQAIQGCRWVYFFMETDLKKFSNGSSAVNGCCQNESPKYYSYNIIILLSPVKKLIFSESGEKYAQVKHSLSRYVGGFWCESTRERGGGGLLETAILWIIKN